MALRKILTQGDPTLNKKSRPVERFDERLHILLDDMKETLAAANGAGLAAPQVGILRRVVVVVDADDHMVELVNPELVYTEGEQTGLEGCLSVPGKYGLVTRSYKARIRSQDRNGQSLELDGEEIVARCFCHELEHLEGHLFTERSDKLYTTEELDAMMERE